MFTPSPVTEEEVRQTVSVPVSHAKAIAPASIVETTLHATPARSMVLLR